MKGLRNLYNSTILSHTYMNVTYMDSVIVLL